MSETKAIEKLRELCADVKDSGFASVGCDAVLGITDEIEHEISEMQESRLSERVYWQNEIHTILDTLTGQKRFWGCNLEYPLGEGALSPSEIATREIAERYQLLPLDADGVPWTAEDREFDVVANGTIELDMIAYSVKTGRWYLLDNKGMEYSASVCRHVKTRTVEDVLAELEGMRGDNTTYEDVVARCSELADELRDLLGGDE